MSREQFLSIYGLGAVMKLNELKELLESRNIDIRKLTNKQIARLLGINLIQTG